ncbi:MAG: transporter substrate-binding domain-containing protein [Deltaproteobacteria bacterium]|nr:transporter substrate-binding domain-containing protein [Deltaproteobacteria bacterium]
MIIPVKKIGLGAALVIIGFLLFGPAKSFSAPLTVFYFERPPYYFTEDNQARGFLVELSRNIFQDAGIKVDFISLPPARIIKAIKNAATPTCSIGWFKKPEREKFAKFSLPIYRDQPLVILTSKNLKEHLEPCKTLVQVFSDTTLSIGKMGSFSYGTYVDELLTLISPKSQTVVKNQATLIKLVDKGRISYMLAAPEEIPSLIISAGLKNADFYSHQLTDVPQGNLRYLIFSRSFPDDELQSVNRAICQSVPQTNLKQEKNHASP